MKYKSIFVDKNKFYSVGIDTDTNTYVMEVIVTSGVWHSRYFKISKEEFEYFNTDKKSILDKLSKLFLAKGIQENNDRFIKSSLKNENIMFNK